MLVMKFGGSIFCKPQNYQRVCEIVNIQRQKYNQSKVCVVVSAYFGMTDQLIASVLQYFEDLNSSTLQNAVTAKIAFYRKMIKDNIIDNQAVLSEAIECLDGLETDYADFINSAVSHPRHYIHAKILSLGEILSSKFLYYTARHLGMQSAWIDAKNIIQCYDHGMAKIVNMEASKARITSIVAGAFEKGSEFLVVPGFFGSTAQGHEILLGRDGSDYTAMIVASSMDCEKVMIFRNTDGVMSTDPGIVSEAQKIDQLSFLQIYQLALHGSHLVHLKALNSLDDKAIEIVNIADPAKDGTLIQRREQKIQQSRIKVMDYIAEAVHFFIRVPSQEDSSNQIVQNILDRVGKMSRLPVKTNIDHSGIVVELNLYFKKSELREFSDILHSIISSEGAKNNINVQQNLLSIIIFVGDNLKSKSFDVMKKLHELDVFENSEMDSITSNDYCLAYEIPNFKNASGLRAVHRELVLEGSFS